MVTQVTRRRVYDTIRDEIVIKADISSVIDLPPSKGRRKKFAELSEPQKLAAMVNFIEHAVALVQSFLKRSGQPDLGSIEVKLFKDSICELVAGTLPDNIEYETTFKKTSKASKYIVLSHEYVPDDQSTEPIFSIIAITGYVFARSDQGLFYVRKSKPDERYSTSHEIGLSFAHPI